MRIAIVIALLAFLAASTLAQSGSTSMDGSTDLWQDSSADPTAGATAFTVVFWERPSVVAGNDSMVMSGDFVTPTRSWSWAIQSKASAADEYEVFVTNGCSSGGDDVDATTDATRTASVWSHVTYQFDGSQGVDDDKSRFWENGSLRADGVGITVTTTLDCLNQLTVGDFPGLTRFYPGELALVAIWNVALSDPLRETARLCGPESVPKNLQHFSTMRDDAGGSQSDSYSGNSLVATGSPANSSQGPPASICSMGMAQ